MNRIKSLDARMDAACQKMFPRIASRLAWLNEPTFTGFSHGTTIAAVLVLVAFALIMALRSISEVVQ